MAQHDDSAEDVALALRVTAERDGPAEALLCRRLFPRIRAYGMRHLRDGAAAADLAQEVLVVVICALREGRVEEPARFAAFVAGVCRNTVRDWQKIERRRATLRGTFGPSLAAEAEGGAPALDRAKLARCLEHLAPRERTILALTYFAEQDAGEIGREIALAAGAVRVARHRAIAQLYDCLTRGEAP
jgi:RNA polymerase sigma-70 factor, ECF subfamily